MEETKNVKDALLQYHKEIVVPKVLSVETKADAALANDANCVHKTGDETINGTKIFNDKIILADEADTQKLEISTNAINFNMSDESFNIRLGQAPQIHYDQDTSTLEFLPGAAGDNEVIFRTETKHNNNYFVELDENFEDLPEELNKSHLYRVDYDKVYTELKWNINDGDGAVIQQKQDSESSLWVFEQQATINGHVFTLIKAAADYYGTDGNTAKFITEQTYSGVKFQQFGKRGDASKRVKSVGYISNNLFDFIRDVGLTVASSKAGIAGSNPISCWVAFYNSANELVYTAPARTIVYGQTAQNFIFTCPAEYHTQALKVAFFINNLSTLKSDAVGLCFGGLEINRIQKETEFDLYSDYSESTYTLNTDPITEEYVETNVAYNITNTSDGLDLLNANGESIARIDDLHADSANTANYSTYSGEITKSGVHIQPDQSTKKAYYFIGNKPTDTTTLAKAEIATKGDIESAGVGDKVSKTGDTMSGALTMLTDGDTDNKIEITSRGINLIHGVDAVNISTVVSDGSAQQDLTVLAGNDLTLGAIRDTIIKGSSISIVSDVDSGNNVCINDTEIPAGAILATRSWVNSQDYATNEDLFAEGTGIIPTITSAITAVNNKIDDLDYVDTTSAQAIDGVKRFKSGLEVGTNSLDAGPLKIWTDTDETANIRARSNNDLKLLADVNIKLETGQHGHIVLNPGTKHVLPEENITDINIGSNSRRFQHLYLSGTSVSAKVDTQTINLSGGKISSANNIILSPTSKYVIPNYDSDYKATEVNLGHPSFKFNNLYLGGSIMIGNAVLTEADLNKLLNLLKAMETEETE